jgi:uncharacterized protein YggT (Ycf19 family)
VAAGWRGGQLAVLPLLAVFGWLRLVISGLTGLVIVYAVLSWVQSNSTLVDMIDRLCAPLLRPFRRMIPLVGGIDLSPLALLVVLQIGAIVLGHRSSAPCCFDAGAPRLASVHCVSRLALQHGQGAGNGLAQFAAVADEVHRALGLQEFRALESLPAASRARWTQSRAGRQSRSAPWARQSPRRP